MSTTEPWQLPKLHAHLQFAVDLELWTIPFYLAAMTSVRDPGGRARALLRSIVEQELLHVQILANVANAYGYSPRLRAPVYAGTLPHLCFDLDTPNPTSLFAPHTAALGPLDHPRLNAMCLIEYPAWRTGHQPLHHADPSDYASVGDFHDALGWGARELREHVRGGARQIDGFAGDYPALDGLTISKDRAAGYEQVAILLDALREQGEGARIGEGVPPRFQAVGGDPEPGANHFAKLNELRDASLPEVFSGEVEPSGEGEDARRVLAGEFARTLASWERGFAGEDEAATFALDGLIAAAQACWINGAVPRFN